MTYLEHKREFFLSWLRAITLELEGIYNGPREFEWQSMDNVSWSTRFCVTSTSKRYVDVT